MFYFFNIDKFESVLFGEITAKGDKTKILIDKLGGGKENALWAEGVLSAIEEAKSGVFENKRKVRDNYAKENNFELIVHTNKKAISENTPNPRFKKSVFLIYCGRSKY